MQSKTEKVPNIPLQEIGNVRLSRNQANNNIEIEVCIGIDLCGGKQWTEPTWSNNFRPDDFKGILKTLTEYIVGQSLDKKDDELTQRIRRLT